MYYALFAACWLAQLIWTPVFLSKKIKRHGLLQKMISSSLFVLTGVFAALESGSWGVFAILIIAGLALGWLGDLLLEFRGDLFFILGLSAFLLGHVCYAAAFVRAGAARGGGHFLSPVLFAVWALVTVLFLLAGRMSRLRFSSPARLIAVCAYCAVITLMLVCAAFLAYKTVCLSCGDIGGLFILAGAVSFVISDAVLALMIFGKRRSRRNEVVNMVTYYLGQMLIASSLLLLYVPEVVK